MLQSKIKGPQKRLLSSAIDSLRLQQQSKIKMEWSATLDEYEKLITRMNTPRSVFNVLSSVCCIIFSCLDLGLFFPALVFMARNRFRFVS